MHRNQMAALVEQDETIHCDEMESLTERMLFARQYLTGDRRAVELRAVQLRVDALRESHAALERVQRRLVGIVAPKPKRRLAVNGIQRRG